MENRLIEVILMSDGPVAQSALSKVQSLLLIDQIVPHIPALCKRVGNKACEYLLQLAAEFSVAEVTCKIIAGGAGKVLQNARFSYRLIKVVGWSCM
jgi:hypothetical protein